MQVELVAPKSVDPQNIRTQPIGRDLIRIKSFEKVLTWDELVGWFQELFNSTTYDHQYSIHFLDGTKFTRQEYETRKNVNHKKLTVIIYQRFYNSPRRIQACL